MTTQTEALNLALEALEGWGKGFPDNWGDLDTEAVTALREALAKSEQEPVAYIPLKALGQIKPPMLILNNVPIYGYGAEGTVAVHTTPPQRKPMTDDEFTTAIEVEGIPVEDVELAYAIKDIVEAAHGIKE